MGVFWWPGFRQKLQWYSTQMRFADKTQTFDKTWAPSTILWLLSGESFEPAKKFTLSTCAKKKKEWSGEGTYHWTSLRRRLTKEGFTSLWKCWFEVMWSKVSFCEWFWCGIFKSRCKLLDNLWLTKSAKDR